MPQRTTQYSTLVIEIGFQRAVTFDLAYMLFVWLFGSDSQVFLQVWHSWHNGQTIRALYLIRRPQMDLHSAATDIRRHAVRGSVHA